MKRIGIVEDYEDMQMMYKHIFRKVKGVEIVLQVATAEEALLKIPQAMLDLIIVDISLPGMDGITFTQTLRKQFPQLKILIVTGHDREEYEWAGRDAGADGYLTKGEGVEMVKAVLRLLQLAQ